MDASTLLLHGSGVLGLALLLAAFGAASFGLARGDAPLLLAANALGSGILAAYSVLTAAWVFFPLELVWCVVAVAGLVKTRARA